MFDSTKWILEISVEHLDWRTGFDGWHLSSKTDTALFKDGLVQNSYGFYVITQDSLQQSLFVDPAGDQILLLSSDSSVYDQFRFGNVPGSQIRSPKLGQSVCLWGDCVYLDNTPTIGQPNDTLNATGNITGTVTDVSNVPLTDVKVYHVYRYDWDRMNLIAATDSSGSFHLQKYICLVKLQFEKENYQSSSAYVQVYPESTVTVHITMDVIQAVNVHTAREALGEYQLIGNYPNPFNAETKISYELPSEGETALKVYDITGKLVKILANGRQRAGFHDALWDGTDSDRRPVASGIYICRIEFISKDGQKLVLSRKMSLVK